MMQIKEKLNYGWSAETDRELICKLCKIKLKTSFHWCEQDDCFYCRECVSNHHCIKNHQDWHIIKLEKEKPPKITS